MNKYSNIKTKIGKKQQPKVCNKNNKIHVALLYGGMSNERPVSLLSFDMFNQVLLELGYSVTPVDVGFDFIGVIGKIKPDVVFNGLYGTYGEDGYIPAVLDMLKLKYTHSGILASMLGFNKTLAYKVFKLHDIRLAAHKIISKQAKVKNDPMSRPYVIKPTSEGSSVGVELVFEEDDFSFANYKWQYGDDIIVEKYIPGRELQVAVFNNKAVGIMEMIPVGQRFHSFDAKYKKGCCEHIMPAQIDNNIEKYVLKIAEEAHNAIGCKTLSRIDIRYNPKEGKEGIYVLEINTHPGMTPTSSFPEICEYYGITKSNILDQLIKDAISS
ncbi:MAG: D-alanine--D-alanine ligase [Rickettsiales bacterium]|nr:D-alanine--D-alanine ligase [Rickettsiales bacterium]